MMTESSYECKFSHAQSKAIKCQIYDMIRGSQYHLTLMREKYIAFFPEKRLPSREVDLFFDRKKRKKLHPAGKSFQLVRVNQKLTMASERARTQGHAGHHLLVVARWLPSLTRSFPQ